MFQIMEMYLQSIDDDIHLFSKAWIDYPWT